MPKIVQLDELTINQVAAGEVIARPSSVVKELIENSIDAGSDKITVEIKKGGLELIKIIDNGSGIPKEDMEIAFERHATSKIRSSEDLKTVSSMGFRGEALPSIASIARVEMVSKTEKESGNKIIVEGGEVLEFSAIGSPKGTSITVTKLFYNTPVRFKFLKKDYTEAGYIEDIVKKIALIYTDISFKFIKDGKVVFVTNGKGKMEDNIFMLFSIPPEDVIKLDYESENIKVSGFIGKPGVSRSSRKNQIFYVNKRNVTDKTLTAALDTGYKGFLMVGKFAFAIINISIPSYLIDVNVHPAKLEIRFEDEKEVFNVVQKAVKNAILESSKESFEELKQANDNKKDPEYLALLNKNSSLKDSSSIREEALKILAEKEKQYMLKAKKMNESEDEVKDEYISEDESKSSDNLIESIFNKKASGEIKPSIERQRYKENIMKKASIQMNKLEEEKKEFLKEVISKDNSFIDEEDKEFLKNIIEETEKEVELEKNNDIIITSSIEEKISEANDRLERVTRLSDKERKEYINAKLKKYKDKILAKKERTKNFKIEDGKIIWNNGNSDEKAEIELDKKLEEIAKISSEIEEKNENEISQNIKKEILEYDNRLTDTLRINEEEEEFEENENVNKPVFDIENFSSEALLTKNGSKVDFSEMYEKAFGKSVVSRKGKNVNETLFDFAEKAENEDKQEVKEKNYRIVGVLFNTFIIIELGDKVYYIDQHAAHERILYEEIKENYYKGEKVGVQNLLMPDVITLSYREMDIIKNNREIFEKSGFQMEDFGINTIKLTGVPESCNVLDTKELFLDIIEKLDGETVTSTDLILDTFLATIACKRAVKAGDKLSEREIEALIRKMFEIENTFTCPHGRPSVVKFKKYDIERMFKRK